MREAKYRGKKFITGEWVTGYHVCIAEKFHYIYTGKLVINKGDVWTERYPVIPETVGQYTNIIDDYGTEICEGDIVEIFNGDRDVRCHYLGVGEVRFHCGEWCLYTNTYLSLHGVWAVDRINVAGNIHDTPELLPENEI